MEDAVCHAARVDREQAGLPCRLLFRIDRVLDGHFGQLNHKFPEPLGFLAEQFQFVRLGIELRGRRSIVRPLVGWFGISHVVCPLTNHPGPTLVRIERFVGHECVGRHFVGGCASVHSLETRCLATTGQDPTAEIRAVNNDRCHNDRCHEAALLVERLPDASEAGASVWGR